MREHYADKHGPDSEELRLTYDARFPEPRVAERVFDDLLRAQPRLTALKRHELAEVVRDNDCVTASIYWNRDTRQRIRIEHAVAIDGTYEGDLAAPAGARHRVGREGRSEYGEQLAGHIFFDWRFNQQKILTASTGEPSDFIQAYCFRLTLTDDPKARVPFPRPASYKEFVSLYRGLLKDFEVGRVRNLREIVWLNPLPNRKHCANGHIEALTSMNLAELNRDWPEGDWGRREDLFRLYREYTEGFWHFLQHDPAVPYILQQEARCFGLARDEYPNEGHFPWQLYVRAARRIIGEHVLTERDCLAPPGRERPRIHRDSIAICEHNFDSHPCRNRCRDAIARADDGFELLEGAIWYRNKLRALNRPATVPYRCMVPATVEGVLVPVAASASHVAFSALRMEPVWMALGQAAGVAAAQALADRTSVRKVDVRRLQQTLARQGQVLVYFKDLKLDDADFAALQLAALDSDLQTFDASECSA